MRKFLRTVKNVKRLEYDIPLVERWVDGFLVIASIVLAIFSIIISNDSFFQKYEMILT